MSGERELTTAQLCARIPDASKAMVYRHVDLLASAGILEVADERRVRGAVERQYRLRHDRVAVDADAVAALTPQRPPPVFATAMAVLVAEFNAYLDREHTNPAADLVGYRQHAVWLSRSELEEMIGELTSRAFCPGWRTNRHQTARNTCSARSSFPLNSQASTPQKPTESLLVDDHAVVGLGCRGWPQRGGGEFAGEFSGRGGGS